MANVPVERLAIAPGSDQEIGGFQEENTVPHPLHHVVAQVE